MVTKRDAIDPEIPNRAVQVGRQSRSIPEVLRIGNDQIRRVIAEDFRETGRQHPSAWSAVQVAEKGDSGRAGGARVSGFRRFMP
jgi:hypothetical protein